MPTDRAAAPSSQRRQIILAISVLIVWFGAMALFLVGVLQSAEAGPRRGAHLAVGLVMILVGAIATSAISVAALRALRELPSPPESSRAERLQVIDDIKHGRVSDNAPLEQAYAARMASGGQRMVILVAGLILIAGIVVLLPGTLQTIALVLFLLVTGAMLVATISQTRRAKFMLSQLPPAGPADPAYQAKVQLKVKTLWRWTGLVFLGIAAATLGIVLVGGMRVGIATGVWIGLTLIWGVGYLHSSWMARPR